MLELIQSVSVSADCRLKNVCTHIVDCNHKTPDYVDDDTGYVCIRTSEMNEGKIIIDRLKNVTEETYCERTSSLKPEENDIVYAREGSFGDAVLIPDKPKFCLGQRTVVIRADISKCYPQYLWYVLTSEYVMSQARNLNTGSTAGRVNLDDIRNYRVKVPSLRVQNDLCKEIETILNSINHRITVLETMTKKLNEYRKSLIVSAITGKGGA